MKKTSLLIIFSMLTLGIMLSCESLPLEEDLATRAAEDEQSKDSGQTSIIVQIDTTWNGVMDY